MRIRTLVSAGFLLISLPSLPAVGLSVATNGICVAVAACSNSETLGGFVSIEPVRFDDGLLWRPFCNTGKVELNYPMDPAYGMKLRMWDAEGKEVTPTPLGASFGSRWNRLHSYNNTRLGDIDAQGPYDGRDGGFTGPPLPAARDLFQMKKPGVYTLEIEMQMFRHTGSVEHEVWRQNLIRFSPVRIKVEKPAEKARSAPLNEQPESGPKRARNGQ